jgi:hypothetical protein
VEGRDRTSLFLRAAVGLLLWGASSLPAEAQTYRVDYSPKFYEVTGDIKTEDCAGNCFEGHDCTTCVGVRLFEEGGVPVSTAVYDKVKCCEDCGGTDPRYGLCGTHDCPANYCASNREPFVVNRPWQKYAGCFRKGEYFYVKQHVAIMGVLTNDQPSCGSACSATNFYTPFDPANRTDATWGGFWDRCPNPHDPNIVCAEFACDAGPIDIGKPTPLAPIGTTTSYTPVFRLRAGLTHVQKYRLVVTDDGTTVLDASFEPSCDPTTCSLNPGLHLSRDRRYEWWIQGSNSSVTGPASDVFSFSCPTCPLAPTPTPRPLDARFVSQNVPAAMTPGTSHPVVVRFKNTGTREWAPVEGSCAFRLGSQSPENNRTWGTGRGTLAAPVAPGETTEIGFDVMAPETPGFYDFHWRMLEECNGWFGGTSHIVSVAVGVTPTPQPKGAVLLLVASVSPLSNGDEAVRDRLVALGYTVTPKYACSAAASDATGKALVVIGGTVPVPTCGEAIAEAFNSLRVPVLVSRAAMFPKMLMTSTPADSGWGSVAQQRRVTIVNPTHPLAGGLSGTVAVEMSPMPAFSWGRANANAKVAATIVDAPNQHALFGYPKGVLMPGGYAPACRVGAFWSGENPASFTNDGWQLFDAAIAWATRPACR